MFLVIGLCTSCTIFEQTSTVANTINTNDYCFLFLSWIVSNCFLCDAKMRRKNLREHKQLLFKWTSFYLSFFLAAKFILIGWEFEIGRIGKIKSTARKQINSLNGIDVTHTLLLLQKKHLENKHSFFLLNKHWFSYAA